MDCCSIEEFIRLAGIFRWTRDGSPPSELRTRVAVTIERIGQGMEGLLDLHPRAGEAFIRFLAAGLIGGCSDNDQAYPWPTEDSCTPAIALPTVLAMLVATGKSAPFPGNGFQVDVVCMQGLAWLRRLLEKEDGVLNAAMVLSHHLYIINDFLGDPRFDFQLALASTVVEDVIHHVYADLGDAYGCSHRGHPMMKL